MTKKKKKIEITLIRNNTGISVSVPSGISETEVIAIHPAMEKLFKSEFCDENKSDDDE